MTLDQARRDYRDDPMFHNVVDCIASRMRSGIAGAADCEIDRSTVRQFAK